MKSKLIKGLGIISLLFINEAYTIKHKDNQLHKNKNISMQLK